jgi:hypothetical protein
MFLCPLDIARRKNNNRLHILLGNFNDAGKFFSNQTISFEISPQWYDLHL